MKPRNEKRKKRFKKLLTQFSEFSKEKDGKSRMFLKSKEKKGTFLLDKIQRISFISWKILRQKNVSCEFQKLIYSTDFSTTRRFASWNERNFKFSIMKMKILCLLFIDDKWMVLELFVRISNENELKLKFLIFIKNNLNFIKNSIMENEWMR